MLADLGLFTGGLLAAFVGAEMFVRGASSVATRFQVPPVVIGLTIVAWGTSAPELSVSLRAALVDQGAVAVGNVVGSNIFNVGIILGVAALVQPMRVALSLIRLDAPILLGLTLLFCLLWLRPPLTRLDGFVLLAVFVAHGVLTFAATRREVAPDIAAEFDTERPRFSDRLSVAVVGLAAGLGLLLYGGAVMVDQAVVLARATGLSERVIALTIVAAGTSTPELLTSVVAAVHRSGDIAIGNIIGSNIFNLAAILGLTTTLAPIGAGALAPLDVVALVVSSAVLLPFLRSGFVLTRAEGVVLLGGYAAYAATLFG